MSEKKRPNFFELLEIDPNKPWSDSEFQTILKNKKAEWTKKCKNPKNRSEYLPYIDMVPNISTVMSKPDAREKEQKEAIQNRSEKNHNLKKDFEKNIELLASKGYLFESEVEQLVTEFAQVFTESDIRNRLRNLSIKIEVNSQSDRSEEINISQAQRTKISKIERDLETLNKKDLYDFLELSKTTTIDELSKKADSKSKVYKDDKSGEGGTIKQLISLAKEFFENDEIRKIYDFSLNEQAFRFLEKNIDIITTEEKTIYARQFAYLLELALKRGLDVDKSSKHIKDYALKKKIAVEVAGVEAIKQKISCPQCQTLNEREQNSCSNCGTSLKIKCPSCGLTSSVDDRACSQCSFPIGNESIVVQYIDESRQLINRKFYQEGLTHLNLAKEAWSTTTLSRPLTDPLTKEIERLKSEAEKKKQELINCQKEINNAINQRFYYRARNLLQEIIIKFPTINLDKEESKIEIEIQKAEAELIKARKLESQGKDPVDLYQNVLWICKDCQPAKDSLAKTPPLPANKLCAKSSNRIINLSWQPSSSKKISYTIIKKHNSPVISRSDGEELATVSGTNYDDTNVEIGKPVFYAVYTNREGILAESAAKLETPILSIAEVSNLVAQPLNNQVDLTWKPPDNVTEIQIYRSTKPFNNSCQGEKVEIINKSNVIDKNLENGKKYYYKIYSLFKNYDGNLVKSEGITIDVIPEQPPTAIEDLKIEVIQTKPIYKLKLSWESPSKGEGAVLRSDRSPDLEGTNLLPKGALSEYGKLLQENKNYVTTTIEDKGAVYFTPVLLFGQNAYFGKTKEYVNVDDVSNLKCQKNKSEIRVRWDWPENCKQVILSHCDRQFPQSHKDSNATHIEITKARYNIKGCYLLQSNVERDYFIVVYAVFNQNKQTYVASGLNESVRARVSLSSNITVDYEIFRKRKFFGLLKGKLFLKINVTGKGQIPELVLIYKQGSIPIRKADGNIALTIPETISPQQEQTTFTYELQEHERCFAKLFLKDDLLYESKGGYVRINKPSTNNMEIF